MARPIKRGLDYFPFDIDLFQDEKVVCVAGEFGLKAEITIVKLLCAVYRNGYFLEWSDKEKMTLLHSLPSVSVGLLDQIIDSLLRWGFFCRSLFESANVLTSEGIQRRYFEAVKFRKIDVEKLPYLLIPNPDNYAQKRVSQGLTPISQGLTPEKQAESTQKEKKDNIKLSNTPSPRTREEELLERFDRFAREVLDGNYQIWREQMKNKYHISDLPEAISKFRQYAIETVLLEKLKGIEDFQRFFAWRINEFIKDNKNGNNNRRGSPSGGSRKGYTTPGCGLERGERE